ncbi:MAG: hypothetical protein HY803_14525 [candidate division NC10 bacterium]|nr:hypothetical protein [candidate division NC10 bacterium]
MSGAIRLTTAQAVVRFLTQQYVERDGETQRFFAGCFGIFGHGNIAGIVQALQQYGDLRYYQCRNEQAMVHTAAAYAKMKNRLQTLVCTSSIGPGATNMVTGAAAATINRLPVLLLPGDIFARRNVAPVLQQLENEHSQDVSVNDCLTPVSRYWDRIYRPDQILTALPEAMRVLTSPVETGAVTLALPQDAQTEAYEYPVDFFRGRVWHVPRTRPDTSALARAGQAIRGSQRPLIVAGGGMIYSGATEALRILCERTGIPVGETMAGKGSLCFDHPQSLGGIGATGTSAANRIARDADLVIGIWTRYSDFTTASKTAFQKNFHLEYGYSTMGYEIAGGLGVKMAAPEREVTVLVGDGSYLMLAQEIVTSVQEGLKLIIVLVDNGGFKSIGSLSRSLGQGGFGTRYVYPTDGYLRGDEEPGEPRMLPVDLAANARSLGARVLEARTYEEFVKAYQAAKASEITTVVYVPCDRYVSVPSYDSWWDVPVAEVSEMEGVRAARTEWEGMRARERLF